MAARNPVPKTIQICFVFTGGVKPFTTCINITNAVAWTLEAMQQVASDIVDAIITDGLGWLSGEYAIANLHVLDLESTSGPSFAWLTGSGSNTLPLAGAIHESAQAAQSAVVTTLRTPNRGRSYRGRTYWPAIAQADLDALGETVQARRLNGQQAFMGALQAAIHTDPQRNLTIVSRVQDKVVLPTPITTIVNSHDTNSRVDTQRRRVKP